jgi:hypothetical protein
MKSYAPQSMMPNRDQFHTLTRGKLSEGCQNSVAWKAVYHLFGVPQNLYKTLDFLASERSSVFVDSGQYLSHSQEHDLVLLMATSVANTEIHNILEIIDQDITISAQDREILKMTVETFRATATATLRALGQILWIS